MLREAISMLAGVPGPLFSLANSGVSATFEVREVRSEMGGREMILRVFVTN